MPQEGKARQLTEWLQSKFPGTHVADGEDVERRAYLFRVHRDEGIPLELDVTADALERMTASDMIERMEQEQVPARLERDPTVRLTLRSSGEVSDVEQRTIECDGQEYRIVREPDHTVRVISPNGVPMEHIPEHRRILASSVWHRPHKDWCADIVD